MKYKESEEASLAYFDVYKKLLEILGGPINITSD